MGKFLTNSRYLLMIPIVGSLISSAVLMIYGLVTVIDVAIDTGRVGTVSVRHAKVLSVHFIELIDVFLLGTVLYIIALGLYELFIEPTPAQMAGHPQSR